MLGRGLGRRRVRGALWWGIGARLVGVCSNNCIYFLSLIKRIIYGLFKNLNAPENARRQRAKEFLSGMAAKLWVT